MKSTMTLILADLLAAPFLGSVVALDAVMVFVRQSGKGSVPVGNKYFRTQAFKVHLANVVRGEISLKNSCLMAQSAASQSFRLDTVDEELTVETFKPGATVEGDAIFVSEDDAVYDASLVRLSDRYKQATSHCAAKVARQP